MIDPFDERDSEYSDLAEPLSLGIDRRTTVRIEMSSDAFDTYVVVTDVDGRLVAEMDDGGDSFDTDTTVELEAGEYTVWTGSLIGSETGSYTLTVSEVA